MKNKISVKDVPYQVGDEIRLVSYQLGDQLRLGSNEGGIFSISSQASLVYDDFTMTDYKPDDEIQTAKGTIKTIIFNKYNIEVYDEDEESFYEYYEDEGYLVSMFAEGIGNNFLPRQVSKECDIVFTEIDASDAEKLPVIGETVKLIDKNKQSISPRLVGIIPSRHVGKLVCLLMLDPNLQRAHLASL